MLCVANMLRWPGVVGVPDEKQIQNALQTKDLFMYFGHSGGEKYIRSKTLRRSSIQAVTLLIGCSSGHLTPNGEFDDWGITLDYLIGGW